jgi:hypothetical protein
LSWNSKTYPAFGHWTPSPQAQTQLAADVMNLQP